MNAREFEILNLLSKREAASRPVPRPVQLAIKPGAPAIPEMVAVAAGSASKDVAARVRAYCAQDSEYAEMLATYERFFQRAEVEETQAEGSILAEMTVKNLVPPIKVSPLESVDMKGLGQFPAGHTLTAQLAAASDAHWLRFVREIRPVLAAYLHRNEIDPARVDDVLEYFRTRLKELTPDARLRDHAPRWVASFLASAHAQDIPAGALAPLDEESFEGLVIDAELLETAEAESGLPQEFCRLALKRRFKRRDELLRFAPDELQNAAWLPTFRLQLFDRAGQREASTAPILQMKVA